MVNDRQLVDLFGCLALEIVANAAEHTREETIEEALGHPLDLFLGYGCA